MGRTVAERRRRALLVLIGAAVAALAAVGLAGAAEHAPKPRLLVLALRDLPQTLPGFQQVDGYVDHNARAARDTGGAVDEFVAMGRLTGYHASFDEKPERVSPDKTIIPFFVHHVESQANLYKSPSHARARFRAQKAAPLPAGVRLVKPKTRVGDEMIAKISTAPNPYLDGATDNVFYVYWRYGPVTAWVLIVGMKETVGLPDAMALAQKQQRRIAQALR
jgi:hypothetical protein